MAFFHSLSIFDELEEEHKKRVDLIIGQSKGYMHKHIDREDAGGNGRTC